MTLLRSNYQLLKIIVLPKPGGTNIYKEYREMKITHTYRATPENKKKLTSNKKSLQELTDNAKKCKKTFTSDN